MAWSWASQSFKTDLLTFFLQWIQWRKWLRQRRIKINQFVSAFFVFSRQTFFLRIDFSQFKDFDSLLWSSSPNFLGLIHFLFFSDTSVPAAAASSLFLDAFLWLVFLLASACFFLMLLSCFWGTESSPLPSGRSTSPQYAFTNRL